MLWSVRARGEATRALLWGGALTAVLFLDDFFLLHESLYTTILGAPELAVYAVYGIAGLAFAWRFRRLLGAEAGALLVLAATAFVLSTAMDLALPGRHLLEDGLKLLGIVLWTIFFVGLSVAELLRRLERMPQGDATGESRGVAALEAPR